MHANILVLPPNPASNLSGDLVFDSAAEPLADEPLRILHGDFAVLPNVGDLLTLDGGEGEGPCVVVRVWHTLEIVENELLGFVVAGGQRIDITVRQK